MRALPGEIRLPSPTLVTRRQDQRTALGTGSGFKGVLKKALVEDDKRSVGMQFRDLVAGLPSGVAHLGVGLAKEAANASVVPLAKDILHPGAKLDRIKKDFDENGLKVKLNSWEETKKNAPIATEMLVSSPARTINRLSNPSQYQKAWRDGTIVGTLVEDLGNLSVAGGMVAGGLGRAAAAAGNAERAARLASAANKVEKVAALGGETANAPMSVLRGGVRVAAGGAGLGLETALRKFAPESKMLEGRNILTRAGRVQNRFGRYGEVVDEKGNVTALEGVGRSEENRAGGNVGRLRERAVEVLPDAGDQAVVEAMRRAIPETTGRGLAEFMPALEADPALAERFIARMGLPEGYGLPELRKIAEAGTGQLDPELAARMAHAREIIAPITEGRTAGFQDPRTFQGKAPGQQFIDESINSFEPLSLAKDRIQVERAAIEAKRAAAEKRLRPVAARAGALERELASREAFAGMSKPISAHEGFNAGKQVGRAQERVTQAQRRATAAGSKLDQAADEYFAAAGRRADGTLVDNAAEVARSARAEADAQVLRKVNPEGKQTPLEAPAFEELARKVADDPAVYDELAAQYHDALKFDDDLSKLENPSKEAIQAYRKQVIDQADQDARSLAGELQRLGGAVDEKGNVTFPIKPRRGTPEWDWWEQLSPKERSKIGAHYLRGGPRGLGIDELASSVGMTVDEWAQKFRETVSAFEEARGLRRDSGRVSQKELAGRMFKEQAGELEQYRPRFSSSEIEAILTRADEIASPTPTVGKLSAADQRATGAAFQRARTARENLNRAVAEYERADRSTARGEAVAADSLARAQEAFDKATAEVATMRTRAQATDAYLRPQNPMTQAQRDAEMRQMGAVKTKARLAGSQRDRLQLQIDRANKDIAQLPAKFDEKLRADPMSYPKRLRPTMAIAQNARKGALEIAKEFEASGNQQLANMFKQGADLILDRPEDWAGMGINPEHAIGGTSGLRADDILNTRGQRKEGTLVQSRSGSYEHMSDQPTKWVSDFKAAAYKEAEAAAAQARNRTSSEMASRFGTTAAKEGIVGDAASIWAEMRSRGLEPWNPDAREGTNLTVPRDKVTPETVWLPKGTIREFQTYWDQGPGPVWASIEAVNRVWKPAVLVANPKWQITNVISGFVGATFSAHESPVTIVKKFREAMKMAKEHPERLPEFSRSTMTADERRFLSVRPEKEPRTKLGKGYKWFSEKSYGLNTFFDNTYKSAVYLAKTEKGVSKFEAVRLANKAIGDFDRLSPFEQRYVKAVLPFYPWVKHITRLTSELAIDDPVRVVWALNVAQHFGDDQSQLPDYLKGSLKVGDKFMPFGSLNPFQDAAGGRNPFLDPKATLGAMSPAIKLAVAAAFGKNIAREGMELTRPASTTEAPLWQRPGELGQMAINQVPLLRFARDVNPFGPGPVARYDTGAKYVVNHDYLGKTSRGQALANLVVPGVPRGFSVEEYQARQAKEKARVEATLRAARKRRQLRG